MPSTTVIALKEWRDLIINILSPKEIFVPVTAKKVIILSIEGTIIGGLIATEATVGLVKYIRPIVTANIIPITAVLLGLEPVMFSIVLIGARYPKPAAPVRSHLRSDVAILLACYRSAPAKKPVKIFKDLHNIDSLEDNRALRSLTLEQLLELCDVLETTCFIRAVQTWLTIATPECIFICNNGPARDPYNAKGERIDFTQEIIAQISSSRIRYFFYSFDGVGNKNFALYKGALEAQKLNFTRLIIADKDVFPCQNILDITPPFYPHALRRSSQEEIDESDHKIAYVNCPVLAIGPNPDKKCTQIGKAQGLEYIASDVTQNALDRLGLGPAAPHGACSLWRTDRFINASQNHNGVFSGEDFEYGRKVRQMGMRAIFATHYPVETIVPQTLPSYIIQRKNSWEMARIYNSGRILYDLITNWPCSLGECLGLKLWQLYYLFQVAADILRLPVFLLSLTYWQYWAVTGISLAMKTVLLLALNYIKLHKHPELQSDLFTILTYWIYNILYQIVCVMALFRVIFYYIPQEKKLIRIHEQEIEERHKAEIAARLGARYIPPTQASPAYEFYPPAPGTTPPAVLIQYDPATRIPVARELIPPSGTIHIGEPAGPENNSWRSRITGFFNLFRSKTRAAGDFASWRESTPSLPPPPPPPLPPQSPSRSSYWFPQMELVPPVLPVPSMYTPSVGLGSP
ncbi:MAG: hypothetical protein KBD64_00615 [Gammaproteobacteria bacterium]|nr:hypothetical protein [Gammaproteobacteria bacterium]